MNFLNSLNTQLLNFYSSYFALLLLLTIKYKSCGQFRILFQFLQYNMLNFRTPLLNSQPLLCGQLANTVPKGDHVIEV